MTKKEKSEIKRIRLIKLWEMLSRETDADNPLGTQEILRRLKNMGIECVRKTLYNDISLLQQYGYEVICNNGVGKSNEYYVEERGFSIPEVQILMNAVQAASFITERKTGELINKVAQLSGSGRGEVLKRNIVEFGTVKGTNENIYYSVNEISAAIISGNKIGFHYFDYDARHERAYRMDKENASEKRVYVVNPLATVFKNDNYYLFCYNDKYGNIAQYRVDRMDRVRVLNEKITPSKVAESFDLAKHKKQLFAMYGGEETKVTLKARNDYKILDVIFDTFGGEINLQSLNDETVEFTADVQVSPTFIAWCCSLGDNLKVTAPADVAESIKEYIQKLNDSYRNI